MKQQRVAAGILLMLCLLLFAACNRTEDPEHSVTISTAANTNIAQRNTADGEQANANVTASMTAAPTTVPSRPATGVVTGSQTMPSGFSALPTVKFAVQDPENSRGLSTKSIAHSYGVAKDGKPHQISIDAQQYFESKHFNAIALDTKTNAKVLYLTFDCGWENGYTAKVLDVLQETQTPAAFFATLDHVKAEPELITRMIQEGHVVGNHSDKHPNFSKINRTRMAQELETFDNYLRENHGYSAPYFRFPEGAYSESALDLVQSCGFKSVFWSCSYADWDVNNNKGKQYAFDTVTSRLHPGAIILLHAVSPDNAEALADIINWARAQGYTFQSITQLPD